MGIKYQIFKDVSLQGHISLPVAEYMDVKLILNFNLCKIGSTQCLTYPSMKDCKNVSIKKYIRFIDAKLVIFG